MTDYRELKKLLTRFGIEFVEHQHASRKLIVCSEGSNGVEGYIGFFTKFEFEIDSEQFIEMGAYE